MLRRPARRQALALALAFAVASTAATAATAAVPGPDAPRVAASCPELRIDGILPGRGRVQVAVYDSEATFRKTAALALTLEAGAESAVRTPLCGLASAEIAVVVMQDLDADGRLDTNLVGMPKEPWGASGRRTLGPPSWRSARVAVAAGPVVVELR